MSDTPSIPNALTERDALTAFAVMFNTGDLKALAPLMAPDFTYTSQNALTDMVGKDTYLAFMAEKFDTLREADLMPVVDLVRLPGYGHSLCAVVWQGQPLAPQCVVYADVAEGRLKAIHLCIAPSPASAEAFGLWPGLPADRRPGPAAGAPA